MAPTKKEVDNSDLRQTANQSASERFHVETEVDLHIQEDDTARHVGNSNLFKKLSRDFLSTLHSQMLPPDAQ